MFKAPVQKSRIIISPRLHALKDKFEQHPGCFLFHTPYTNKAKRAGEITRLMSALKAYIDAYGANPFFQTTVPPKVLVTLDSSGKVLDVLRSCGATDKFLYVVDEFQCLMGDAVFKGNTDMSNPVNKPFTFCTKASFEGVDFYSTNAITYVFINAGKEWQTLDIMLDIPQILGRQRLDINPFRHDATVYYKTKPGCLSQDEFRAQQQMMEQESEKFIDDFNNASPAMKERLIKLVRDKADDKKFVDDYVDVFQVNGQATLGINHLVQVAKWNQWHQRSHYYTNSCQLTASIRSAVKMNVKPQAVKDFEAWYYSAPEKDRLKGYSDFRNANPQFDGLLLQNPFIDQRYHEWYGVLGYDTLAGLDFDTAKVEAEYANLCSQAPIMQECQREFSIGSLYTKPEVKQTLQHIYNSLGLVGKTAKATDITQYLNVRERMITNSDGKRIEVYEIMP